VIGVGGNERGVSVVSGGRPHTYTLFPPRGGWHEACAMTTVPATRTVDAHAQRPFRSH
jgi:hypothetical protein